MAQVKCEYAYKPGTKTPIHCRGAPRTDYECPICRKRMYVVPQDRKQTSHFRHYERIDHDVKSVIHDNAKFFLLDLLQKLQSKNKGIFIDYTCPFRTGHSYTEIEIPIYDDYLPHIKPRVETFKYHLLSEIDDILVEKQTAGAFIPDISLMKNSELHTAIEIVNTHKDEDDKNDYYEENRINVIRIDVGSIVNYDTLVESTTFIHSNLTQESRLYKNGCGIPIVTTIGMIREYLWEIGQEERRNLKYLEYKRRELRERAEREREKQKEEIRKSVELARSKRKNISTPSSNKTIFPKHTAQEIQEIANKILEHISNNHYEHTFTIFGIARRVPDDSSYYLRVSVLNSLLDHGTIEVNSSGYKVKQRNLPSNITIVPETLRSKP